MTELLNSGPDDALYKLILAHGAGAAMTSPFMELFAGLLGERKIATVRFEFDYMASRRQSGKRRAPPRADTLIPEYEAVIEMVSASTRPTGAKLFIGGKSMGGRVASMIAEQAYRRGGICGLVCLGYPFHPPSKPDQLRTAHLETLTCPALFVQGERDPFGTRQEIEAMSLPRTISLHWAADGDHDLGPRGGSGFTRKGNLAAAADAIVAFMNEIAPASR